MGRRDIFDACLRFLNEDPWERLRKIKDKAKNTPIQMLFRGQNILGYKHYADDVVDYFVKSRLITVSISSVSLTRLMTYVICRLLLKRRTKRRRTYRRRSATQSAPYTISSLSQSSQKSSRAWARILFVSRIWRGLLLPYTTYDLIKAIKETVKIPVQLHTHYTSGRGFDGLPKGC